MSRYLVPRHVVIVLVRDNLKLNDPVYSGKLLTGLHYRRTSVIKYALFSEFQHCRFKEPARLTMFTG